MKDCLLKKITTHIAIYGLITAPIAYGQEASSGQQAIMGALGALQKIGGAFIDGKKQQINQIQNYQNLSQFQPQTSTAKYFPECQVPMAVSPFPKNACTHPPRPGDRAGLSTLQTWLTLSSQYDSHFRHHTSENQNTRNATELNKASPKARFTPSIGASCLDDALKRAGDKLQGPINQMNETIAQVKKSNEKFRDQLKQALENIQDTAHVLYGNPRGSSNTKGRQFHTLFSPRCQELIGTNSLNATKKAGLIGLRDQVMATPQELANRFTNPRNRQNHIDDIKSQITAIQNEIKKRGPEAWDPSDRSFLVKGSSVYTGMADIIQRKKGQFDREISEIRSILKKEVGFELPRMDHQFRHNTEAFSQQARDFFERKFINDCVTQGSLLKPQDVLKGLRQKSTRGRGTTLSNYRTALQNILESDTYMEQKLNAIRQLDAQYSTGEITVVYQSASGSQISTTPYGLFKEQVGLCQAKMEQDNTHSLAAPGSKAAKDKIARADRYIKQALALEKRFSSELYNTLYEELVNCSGKPIKTSTCHLANAGNILEPTGKNFFCVAHATECGKNINSCYAENQRRIIEFEQKRDGEAARYNQMMTQLEKNQQFFLDQMKTKVAALASQINGYIPGSQIQWPNDLVVSKPEEKVIKELGVKLKGGGNLEILNEVPQKLQSLVAAMEQQKSAALQEIASYIGKQKAGWRKEAKRWARLGKKCERTLAAYHKGVQEQAKAKAEAVGEARQFCRKYDALRQNPGAGCGSVDDLFEDAINASSFVNPQVLAEVNEFKGYCDSVNNEKKSEDEEEDESKKLSRFERFLAACEDNGGEWEQVLEEMKKDAKATIPVEDYTESEYDAIVEAIDDNSKIKDLDSEIKETPFYESVLSKLQRFHEIEEQGGMPVSLVEYDSSSDALPEYLQGKYDRHKGMAEQNSDGDYSIKNLCQAQEYMTAMQAIEECQNADEGKYRNCYQEEIENNQADPIFKKAGRALASLDNAIRTSRSEEIGEMMSGIPCMAQQGYNGARGLPSAIQQLDQLILGGGVLRGRTK